MNDSEEIIQDKAKITCSKVLAQSKKIRHVGYYDSFGRVLYDAGREKLEPLKDEGVEEMHILNGTAASTLTLWKRSECLLGGMNALIMLLGKVVDLIVPETETGSYFLVVFDNDTSMAEVERVRLAFAEL
jgi:hypothetical protein